MPELFRSIPLTLRFTVPLCGGVPKNPDVIRTWVEVRQEKNSKLPAIPGETKAEKPLEECIAATTAVAGELPDKPTEYDKVWVGFMRDATGLYIRGANLRAHLKDCATVLGQQLKEKLVEGFTEIKQFRGKLIDRLYVKEEKLYIRDGSGTILREPTDFRDATMTVMTAQGPRTCLKRVDFVEGAVLLATLQFMEAKEIHRDHLVLLLQYGGVHGFGQDRSLQFGRYEFELGE